MVSAETAVKARKALEEMKGYLEAPVPSPGPPNLTTARAAVEDLWEAARSLSSMFPSTPEDLLPRTLLRSYASFEALFQREIDVSACLLAEAFFDEVAAEVEAGMEERLAAMEVVIAELKLAEADNLAAALGRSVFAEAASESVALYTQVVTEFLSKEHSEARARMALRSLMIHLQLGQDEMGRLFGVSGETVRRWERGKTTIPVARETEILRVEAGLSRLLEMFRLDRLPLVVRREADLFEGDTALEWILRGRIHEVADRYETTFRYQA